MDGLLPHSSPDFATQVIPRDDIEHVVNLINVNNTYGIEDYLLKCRDLGLTVFHQYAMNEHGKTMVCLIEEIHKTSHNNLTKNYQNYRVLGFPVISSNIYRKKIQFKLSSAACGSHHPLDRRLGVASLDAVEVLPNSEGKSLVIDFKTVSSLDAVQCDSALDENSYGELVLHNTNTDSEDWYSLRISRKHDDTEVVETILDLIPDDQVSSFISQADKLGMTSLHWSAYTDSTTVLAPALDRMSLVEQQETVQATDNRGWTMMHTAAYKDANSVMKTLQNKFGSEKEVKWKVLTCRTADGKTLLHIAVAERNIKAVITLLDFADDDCGSLLAETDNSGKTGLDYAAQGTLLEHCLRLAGGINQMSILHGAAKNDDVKTVELVLENIGDSESIRDICLREDRNGFSVLQTAAVHNSVRVMETLTRQMPEDDCLQCLTTIGSNGETALHMACISSKPSAIGALLRFVDYTEWGGLLESRNREGRSLDDKAQEWSGVQDIIKYHRLLSSKGPKEFFKEMDYGLLHIKPGNEFVESRHKILENRTDAELSYVRSMNYDTATCIIQGDFDNAKDKIDQLLQSGKYTDHVHTVCHQGILKIEKKCDTEEVIALAKKVLDQLADDKSRITTKIDYAYWIAEAERSEDARNTSCGVFEACLLESLNCSESAELQATIAYHYSKVLIRMMREKELDRPKSWYEEMIFTVVHLFLMMAKADPEEHLGNLWLWIAEQQCNLIRDKAGQQLCLGLKHLQDNEPQLFSNLRPAFCLQQAIALRGNYEFDTKFVMRIAKNCTDLAYDAGDEGQRKFWFTKALELSEEGEGHNDNTFMMCLLTSIKACISLWAMDVYPSKKEDISRCYKLRTGKKLGPRDIIKAWRFVEDEYYNISLRDDPITRKHLGKAKDYLVKYVDNHKNGWRFRGSTLGRVKYILGDPEKEVLDCFDTALRNSETPRDYIATYQQYGRYYEILEPDYRGGLEKAYPYHMKAIKMYEQNIGKVNYPHIASHSKKCLEKLSTHNP